MSNRFTSFLEKRFGLTGETARAFGATAQELKIPKGTVLLQPGEIPRHSWFVENGCLRSYVPDQKGREHIVQFAPEEWIIGDPYALINQQPSLVYIDAIEDTEAVSIGSELFSIGSATGLMDRMRPLINSLHATQRRLVGILSLTAEERYLEFIKAYPSLSRRLPQGMIASYIGVTPQSLSRIRHQLAGKA